MQFQELLCLSACLGTSQEELEEVAVEKEVWVSLLRLIPLRPDPE